MLFYLHAKLHPLSNTVPPVSSSGVKKLTSTVDYRDKNNTCNVYWAIQKTALQQWNTLKIRPEVLKKLKVHTMQEVAAECKA